jgi:S-adenosylmethionine decarboxylase
MWGSCWLKALGQHLLLELYGCDPRLINDLEHVRYSLLHAAELVSASIIDVISRKFEPHGVTVVVAIAESHLSIHTWPEYAYAAVDVFTCSAEPLTSEVQDYLIHRMGATEATCVELKRGILAGRWARNAVAPAHENGTFAPLRS